MGTRIGKDPYIPLIFLTKTSAIPILNPIYSLSNSYFNLIKSYNFLIIPYLFLIISLFSNEILRRIKIGTPKELQRFSPYLI